MRFPLLLFPTLLLTSSLQQHAVQADDLYFRSLSAICEDTGTTWAAVESVKMVYYIFDAREVNREIRRLAPRKGRARRSFHAHKQA